MLDLSHLPAFFERLDAVIQSDAFVTSAPAFGASPYRQPPLVVHRVGMFEASFVPTRGDFARLDLRFRLSQRVLDALGERDGYGFVVVKLAKSEDVTVVHPIGFTFPMRDPARLFFPTVHVHDGEVHPVAGFDHALYTTDGARAAAFAELDLGGGAALPALVARASRRATWLSGELDHTMCDRAKGELVARGARVYRVDVRGERANDDAWIEATQPPVALEITDAIERATDAGATPPAVRIAVHATRNRRASLLQRARSSLLGLPDVEICAVRRAERGGGSVFWVHARNANLRGPSDIAGARALLCALAPAARRSGARAHEAIVPLDSRESVDAWLAAGADVTAEDAAWLRDAAQ